MKLTVGYILAGAAAIVAAFLLIWGLALGNLTIYRHVGPQQQAAERQVYVQTPSYILGKQQALSRLRSQYLREKDPAMKAALRGEIENEMATVDKTELSSDLQSFLRDLETEKGR